MNDCPGQTARVTSNLHSSSSTMAVSRVPSPPLPEVNTPVAENWCYTQVSRCRKIRIMSEPWPHLRLCGSMKLRSAFREGIFFFSFASFFDREGWMAWKSRLEGRLSFVLLLQSNRTRKYRVRSWIFFFVLFWNWHKVFLLSKLNVTLKVNRMLTRCRWWRTC